jgi:hypothetical protein
MNNDLGIDINEGISQAERQLSALAPDYAKIDERDLPDFLMFVSALSEQFNYFNHKNHRDGNWEVFFKSDSTILVALLSRMDFSKQLNTYEQQLSGLLTAESDHEQVAQLKQLFEFMFNSAVTLVNLQEQFKTSANYSEIREVSDIINSIGDTISVLSAYNRQAGEQFGSQVNIDFSTAPVITWNMENVLIDEIFSTGPDPRNKITNALPYLTRLFDDLSEKYNHLTATAGYYLKTNQLLKKKYAPHIGLFMTLLGLYRHLKANINELPKRHLDLYFKDLLGIMGKPAEPDRVHLILEKEEGPTQVLIKPDDLLEAAVSGSEDPLLYRLLVSLTVTKAAIAELKTLFISDYLLLPAHHYTHSDVIETQVYSASHPTFSPAAYLKNPRENRSWPVQGEDQHDLSGAQRTMADTDIGLIIGSPLFYQTEGERTFHLTIHFDQQSTDDLKAYIGNYAAITKKKENVALYELLSSAFIIHYTGAEGWNEVQSAKISFTDGTTGAIELSFTLSSSSGPVHIYDPLLHGDSHRSPFPLIRLLLNNYSTHNPYTFFRNTIINRVSVKVQVHGHMGLKLQNNIGALSPANPFQPFGPQPTVGSFLNLKNTNIFNRYTRDFCLHIEWLDLPKDKEGFDSYYKGYAADIKNSSFKIGLSTLLNGRFRPEAAHQQQFGLFETDGEDDLIDYTDIQGVDFKKIEFLNAPQLAKEDEASDVHFKEGVVKLELLAPAEAFGHRLFPQIFPEVVMHNARTFARKRPLPNQPYIPVMKSISVDYTVAHTETLKDDKEGAGTGELLLIHQYPFGHEAIYPNNNRKTYAFMPQFHHSSNLYVGLRDLQPHQELSLLFQLEEKKFHHTVHEPEPINWAYLVDNSWTPLPVKDVLYDTTNNFINSGVVKVKIPGEICQNNSILNPDLFWLRASVEGSTDLSPRVIAIHTNAVTAERVMDQASQSTVDFILPPNIIKNFSKNVKGIQNLWQLFPSSGGRPEESQEHYYVRVSERLRHKQRPVQIIDIVQVVLEKFPEILIVKCFSNSAQEHLVLPGVNLQVIVIPKEKEDGRFISEEPKVSLSTLYKVKKFLTRVVSPFANIEVGNPAYEKVKVVCKVVFADTEISDNGFYLRRLNEDINAYIAPWLYGREADLKIGSRIYKSDILNFIKTRPYVAYTTGFSVIHFYKKRDIATESLEADILDTAFDSEDYISCSTQEAVLIPSASHLITVLGKSDFEEPRPTGIGSFLIGDELLVTGKYESGQADSKPAEEEQEKEELFSLIITHTINDSHG